MLSAATHAYFNQSNFSDREILEKVFLNVNTSLRKSNLKEEYNSYLHMGVDVREFLCTFGRQTLVLVKAILAGKRIVFHSIPISRVCRNVLSIVSLIPGALTHFSQPMLQNSGLEVPSHLPVEFLSGFGSKQSKGDDGEEEEEEVKYGKLGFPLLPFSNCDVVQEHWSHLHGERSHRKFLFLPFR